MKNLSSLYILIFLVFFFSGCDTKTTYETINTDQKYSLELPSYLQKGTDLHDDASLQYQNLLKEFYIVVIEDNKEDLNNLIDENEIADLYSKDFTGYSDLLVEGFKENPDVGFDGKFTEWKIGTLDAKYFKLSAQVEGLDVFYHYTLIEGKNTYYQVMQWTLADRKDAYKDEMEKIAKSFKEL